MDISEAVFSAGRCPSWCLTISLSRLAEICKRQTVSAAAGCDFSMSLLVVNACMLLQFLLSQT